MKHIASCGQPSSYSEETHIRCAFSQTSVPIEFNRLEIMSRLVFLLQRINCEGGSKRTIIQRGQAHEKFAIVKFAIGAMPIKCHTLSSM